MAKALIQAQLPAGRRGDVHHRARHRLQRCGLLRLELIGQAEGLGLRVRGVIAPRHYADIALVEAGPLRPRVRGTVRNGQFIYLDQVLTARNSHAAS